MTSFVGPSMQNWVSFESMWHRECDESYRESIAQLHRTRWAKNRILGPKIKIVSENRKSIFRSKLMPISVMIGPNEQEKFGRFPGTEIFHFLLHRVGWGNLSLVFCLPSHKNFKLTTSGKIVVLLPQVILPLTKPVQFLTELGFH